MSVFLLVIDGLGIWNPEKKSTINSLMEMCSVNYNILPFLYKIGLKEAIEGKGNLLEPKSSMAGSLEGHREMMGYISTNQYDICKFGIPSSIINTVYLRTNIKCIGNIQGRGGSIIPRYSKLLKSPSIILYSGYDSTISLAFMDKDYCIEDIINYANILIEEMYYNNIRIRKIIIRQYDNNFTYIKTRKEIFNKVKFDDTMKSLRFPKIIINNKIQDILNLNCAEVIECNNDDDCIRILGRREEGFYFINFSDFDSYAHKGDALMCLRTLEKLDGFIEKFWKKLKRDDYIIITSDHGVKIINSDLSNAHVLEDVALLCLDKYGYYYFDCKKNGLDYIHNIIHNIQDKRCFGDRYYKL